MTKKFKKLIFFPFCIFFISSLSLLAMQYEEERGSPLFRPVLKSSLVKVAAGVGFLYTEKWLDNSEHHPSPDAGYWMRWGGQASAIYGIKLIMSACYDVGSYLYKNLRQASIDQQIKKLKSQYPQPGKHKKKARELTYKINNLSKQDPQKEITSSLKYLNNGLEIFSAFFWISQTLEIMYTAYGIGYGYDDIYTIFPELRPGLSLTPRINIITKSASLLCVAWSVHDFISQAKGKTPGSDSPIRSFIRACANTSSSQILEEKLRRNVINSLRAGYITTFKHLHISIKLFKYLYYLRIGDGLEHFYKGCNLVYNERKQWFSLVDELVGNENLAPSAEDREPLLLSPERQPIKSEFNPYEEREMPRTFVKNFPDYSFSDMEQTPSMAPDPVTRKTKIKTRNLAGKSQDKIEALTQICFQRASTSQQPRSERSQHDQDRQNALEKIHQKRLDNSVTKKIIKSMYEKASKFVDGKITKTGNKITINWMRGQRARSVKFEWSHKQKNEKASVFKGHKLKMVLDALEQIYLDGWDKESILSHLNGRFKMHNLPYELIKVLWSSQDEG